MHVSCLVKTVVNTIRSKVQLLKHTTRSSNRAHKLPNVTATGVRADRVISKNNITFYIDTRVRTIPVDKLTMVGTIFIKENLSNFLGGTEKA